MTREEAIEVIEQDIPCEHDTDLIEALEMAIKALEQEPCDDVVSREAVKELIKSGISTDTYEDIELVCKWVDEMPPVRPQLCDDAISREWLKTAIHNFYYGLKHTPTEEDIQAYIDVAPPVRPQEQTGHWIETEYHRWRCSVCREKGMSEWDNIHNVRTNFCSECGARMVEPQESEGTHE